VPRKYWLLTAICYTLFLAIFSLVNIDAFPKLNSENGDKVFHLLAYGLLILLWYVPLHTTRIVKSVIMIGLFSFFYGIILEVLQKELTMARKFDVLDIVANGIGVTIMSVLIIIKNKTIVKNL